MVSFESEIWTGQNSVEIETIMKNIDEVNVQQIILCFAQITIFIVFSLFNDITPFETQSDNLKLCNILLFFVKVEVDKALIP